MLNVQKFVALAVLVFACQEAAAQLSPYQPPLIDSLVTENRGYTDSVSRKMYSQLHTDGGNVTLSVDFAIGTMSVTTAGSQTRHFNIQQSLTSAGFASNFDESNVYALTFDSRLENWERGYQGFQCALVPCHLEQTMYGNVGVISSRTFDPNGQYSPGQVTMIHADFQDFSQRQDTACQMFNQSLTNSFYEAGVSAFCPYGVAAAFRNGNGAGAAAAGPCAGAVFKQIFDSYNRVAMWQTCNDGRYPGPGNWRGSRYPRVTVGSPY